MIIPERMSVYINSLDVGNGAFLDELEQEALRDDVPIIRQDMQSFLKVLLAMHQPKQILEVGTAVGFSALLMAANTEMCHITTIEKYEKRIPVAKENFQKSGMGHRITLLEGDALAIMQELTGTYDMIFMDAAKGQYKLFYDMIIDKLRVDGLLISDNILYKGMVAHDDFVIRRKKTIVKRMRNYLDYICNCDYLSTSLIPIGDGVALSYKNNKRGDINA